MKLTKTQRDKLYMDCYAEYEEGQEGATLDHGEAVGGEDGIKLRAELRAGREVTVTPYFIEELKELSDRDADPVEQRMYRRILEKCIEVTA